MLDVVTHSLHHLSRAVRSIAAHEGIGFNVGVVMAVGMTAGGRNGTAADHHTGAGDLAAVNRIADGHIQEAMVAAGTDGSKTSHQIALYIVDGTQGGITRGLVGSSTHGAALAVGSQMHMAVAEAGSDKLAGEIDDLTAVKLGFGSGHNRFDAFAVGIDHNIFPDSAGGGVKHLGALDCFFSHGGLPFPFYLKKRELAALVVSLPKNRSYLTQG